MNAVQNVAKRSGNADARFFDFTAFGSSFSLELSPNHLNTPNEGDTVGPSVTLYSGFASVARPNGQSVSGWVRASTNADGKLVSAFMQLDDEIVVLQPLAEVDSTKRSAPDSDGNPLLHHSL